MSGRWRETSPQELARLLAGLPETWAIAGGWALELWQGAARRAHSDIEITCLRKDLPTLLSALQGFEIAVARNKQLTPYSTDQLSLPHFSLWVRREGETLWDFEILTEMHEADTWRYRRDPAVMLPLPRLFEVSGSFRLIAPEVQLLYKCKAPRPKDLDDLGRCWALLETPRKAWLRAAVARAHPESLRLLD